MTRSNKYLYQAVYHNGQVYDQNVEDRSVQDPSKSCYHDIDQKQVRYFTLSNGIDAYTLDLSDGGLAINGSHKIYLTSEELHSFELIHFRKVRVVRTENEEYKSTAYVVGFRAKDINEQQHVHTIMIV